MAPPELPRSVSSTSLADRLAALNARSSSSTKTPSPPAPNLIPGAGLRDRIGKFNDVGGKPLVPKSSFGLGVAPEGGPSIGRGMVGNRIPSGSREGFGVSSHQPRSASISSASGRSMAQAPLQPQHTGPLRTMPPASIITQTAAPPTVTTSSTDSPRSTSSNGSFHALDSNLDATSSSPSTSISSAFVQTTNVLPPSMLSATHPDVSSLATSRPSSILAHGSSTSVASLASVASASSVGSNPSVASSYDIEPQQPPYTEVQASEEEMRDSASIRSGISRTSSTYHLGVHRTSSPVGSLVVEPAASAAPSERSYPGSEAGTSDVFYAPSSPALSIFVETGSVGSFSALPEQQEAPLTPRATEDRHLDLDLPPLDDLPAASTDTPQTPTDPISTDPLASALSAMRIDPSLEPQIESASSVPAILDLQSLSLSSLANETSLPLEEIGGEAEVDVKVESWQEGVVPSMIPEVESGGEVDVEGKVETWVGRLREAEGREGSVRSAASDVGRDDEEEGGEAVGVKESKTQEEDIGSAPAHQDDHPQPHSAESASIDHLIADLDRAQSATTSTDISSSSSASPQQHKRPAELQSTVTPRKDATITPSHTTHDLAFAAGPSDEELKSPIPGAFPDTPTHSGFIHSVSSPSPPPQQPVFRLQQEQPAEVGLNILAPSSPLSTSPSVESNSLPPSTPTPPSHSLLSHQQDSIPFPHQPTPPPAQTTSTISRSPSSRLKNPHEIDSEDDDEDGKREGGEARVLSREKRRYS